MKSFKKFVAECFGTMFLVFFACGIACFACKGLEGGLFNFIVAMGFGFALIACIYTIGYVSGSHVNPAVSLAMLIDGRMKFGEFIGYVISQFIGGFAGAALLSVFAGDTSLGTNTFTIAPWMAILIEVILTCMFVYTVMCTTAQDNFPGAGIVNGFALALVHMLGVSFTGTSVNPARSFGPAIMKAIQGDTAALSQYWVFLVAPLAGAVLAAVLYRIINRCKCEK